jgi:TfoX/Sxy family transcriptional regulator of competence genes
MPYNLDLEKKIDHLTAHTEKYIKKKMFGGVGYLLDGNMVFGIHRQSLVLRTSPERAAELLKKGTAAVFDITGRPMKGWLLISPTNLQNEKHLSELLEISLEFVKTLPPKQR